VKQARQDQAPRDAETRRNGVQSLRAVEGVILYRIDDVETGEPEQDRERQEYGNVKFGEMRWAAAHGEPGAERRERERQPEKKMACPGKSLRERIEKDDRERQRRKQKTQRV